MMAAAPSSIECLTRSLQDQLNVVSPSSVNAFVKPKTATSIALSSSQKEEFEKRAEKLLASLRQTDLSHNSDGNMWNPALQGNPQDSEPAVTFTSTLLELVQVSGQLSQLDAMLGKAAEASTTDESKTWRDISVCALEWSRSALVQRQAEVAVRLERTTSIASGMLATKSTATADVVQDSEAPVGPPPGLGLSMAPFVSMSSPLQSLEDDSKQLFDEVGAASGRQIALEEFEKSGTLRSHLERINLEDEKCVLIARRINRLGFHSATLLQDYFERFGGAKHVYVAHSRAKPSMKRANRIRPAGLGFIVMHSPEAAAEAEAVAQHEVQGSVVEISFYKDSKESSDVANGDAELTVASSETTASHSGASSGDSSSGDGSR